MATPTGLERSAFPCMGTVVTVLAPAAAFEHALKLVETLFENWDLCFSRFKTESELSRLNRSAGVETAVSPLLFLAAAKAMTAAEISDGVFDPLLLDQMLRCGYDRTFTDIPTNGPALDAQAHPGGAWRGMRLDPARRTVRLPAGTGMDLGGLVKGMAVDAALTGLRRAAVACAAVDAGGDLAVMGLPPGLDSWPIEIETGWKKEVVPLRRGALATSTVGKRRWNRGGVAQHHLIDPRTGSPAESGVWSVSAAAPTCAEAEIAAKVALILGSEAGCQFLESNRWAGLITSATGESHRAGGWPSEQLAVSEQWTR
ncbi:MAG TPA: FAD:protein FMN transferase [Candidatus Dormibacteraeota bacterium]|nr:FAD:protein FMN transferase [Candidatus Dormibacteraeota bacterium]